MPDSHEVRPRRAYPPIYEKFLPYALGIIAFAIVALLILSVLVLAGVFPAAS